MSKFKIDGKTPQELEVERAKERFESEHPNALPEYVRFREKAYKTIDAEKYQGLVIINLDDGGKVLRADAGLCRAVEHKVCPTCGQEVPE